MSNWTLYQPITVTAFQNDFKINKRPSRSLHVAASISISRAGWRYFLCLQYRFAAIFIRKVFVIEMFVMNSSRWFLVCHFDSYSLSFCCGFVCNYTSFFFFFASYYKPLCNVYKCLCCDSKCHFPLTSQCIDVYILSLNVCSLQQQHEVGHSDSVDVDDDDEKN